jgi:hypothetical protein
MLIVVESVTKGNWGRCLPALIRERVRGYRDGSVRCYVEFRYNVNYQILATCEGSLDFMTEKSPVSRILPRKSLSADKPQMSVCLYPCPCGYWGDPTHNCTCSPAIVTRYQKRISGPLLARFDTRSASTCRASITKNSPLIAPANRARPFASACCPRARSSSPASTAAASPAMLTHLHLQRTPYPPLCGGGAPGGVQVWARHTSANTASWTRRAKP